MSTTRPLWGPRVPLVLVNAMGSGPRSTERRAEDTIRAAIARSPRQPWLVAVVEAQDLADDPHDFPDYRIHHTRDADQEGLALLVRKRSARLHATRYVVGAPAVLHGRRATDMRTRKVLVAAVEFAPDTDVSTVARLGLGHMPPKRNWRPWWDHMADVVSDLADRVDLFASDWNKERPAVAHLFGGGWSIYMDHIVGWVVQRRRVKVTDRQVLDVGADHAAYYLEVRFRRTRSRAR